MQTPKNEQSGIKATKGTKRSAKDGAPSKGKDSKAQKVKAALNDKMLVDQEQKADEEVLRSKQGYQDIIEQKTKAIMEKLAISKARDPRIQANKGVICATRYGNVMCSRGSIIPLFG